MEAKRKRFTRDDAVKIPPGGFVALPEVQDGFGVRCSKGGVHSWVLRYTLRGRRRWISLGRVATTKMSVAEAAAEDVRSKVARDIDPLARKRGEDVTVTDFAKDYIKRHAKPHKKPSSVAGTRNCSASYRARVWRRLVSEITERDVRELHHSLADTPIRANRVAALLSCMLDRAMAWGVIPRGQTRLSVAKTTFTRRSPTAVPDGRRVQALWTVLDRFERSAIGDHARVVKLLLLTGVGGLRSYISSGQRSVLRSAPYTCPTQDRLPSGGADCPGCGNLGSLGTTGEWVFPASPIRTSREVGLKERGRRFGVPPDSSIFGVTI